MMVYSAINESEDTIKNIAFKFVSEKDFLTALVRSVEGSTRGFVATKRQAEILALRGEIVAEVKENLAAQGFELAPASGALVSWADATYRGHKKAAARRGSSHAAEAAASERLDVRSLFAFGAVRDLERNALVLFQGLETRPLDLREVGEDVIATAFGLVG